MALRTRVVSGTIATHLYHNLLRVLRAIEGGREEFALGLRAVALRVAFGSSSISVLRALLLLLPLLLLLLLLVVGGEGA